MDRLGRRFGPAVGDALRRDDGRGVRRWNVPAEPRVGQSRHL
jgi:hypothetical protein